MAQTKLADQIEKYPAHMLEEAFERFSRSSARLERKYAVLLKESEALRAQLQEKDREIQRAEQLATLGKTAAAMAHEIRNPLGAMKLFSSLLKQDLAENPASIELVESIESSIQSINHVVSNILQFSRTHTPTFSPVNIHSVVKEQLEEVKRYLGVQIEEQLNANNPFLTGNEHGLRQMFSNLFLNACQAMRYSGTLQIRTEDSDDDSVTIHVRDNGPGVPAELRESLFEPFVTSRNEGTGLGLAIVAQIVGQHGGRISVPHLLDGAEFQLYLPRHQNHGER